MIKNLKTKLKQAVLFLPRLVKGRTNSSKKMEDIAEGEGAVIEENGKKIAVYKKKSGGVVKLSPSCTHLGCIVSWDEKKQGWECPCHGSYFTAEGKRVKGPASKDLPRYE